MKNDVHKILDSEDEKPLDPFCLEDKISVIEMLEDKKTIFTFIPRTIDYIKRVIRRYKHKIYRTYEFSKLGWNDYDWDESYLLTILEFKLKKMYEFFSSDLTTCQDADKRAEQIKIALDACSRMLSGEYDIDALKSHNEKWGETITVFGEKNPKTKCTPVSFKRPNVKTDEDDKQERKEFMECMNKAQEEYEKDSSLLFDTMKNYHHDWWD